MEIVWTDMALEQLGDSMEYVADKFGKNVARKSYDKIKKRVQELAVFPESGRYDGMKFSLFYSLRHLTIAPNVVYYLIDEKRDFIVIMAVIHSCQSPQTVCEILERSLTLYSSKS